MKFTQQKPTNLELCQDSVRVLHYYSLVVYPAADVEDVCWEAAGDQQGGQPRTGHCQEEAGQAEYDSDHPRKKNSRTELVEAAADLQRMPTLCSPIGQHSPHTASVLDLHCLQTVHRLDVVSRCILAILSAELITKQITDKQLLYNFFLIL